MVYSAFPRSVMRQVALSTGPRMRLANTSTAADHPLACPSISHESFPANGSHQSTTLQLLFPLQLLEGLTLMLFAKLFLFLEFRSGHNLVRSSALIQHVIPVNQTTKFQHLETFEHGQTTHHLVHWTVHLNVLANRCSCSCRPLSLANRLSGRVSRCLFKRAIETSRVHQLPGVIHNKPAPCIFT